MAIDINSPTLRVRKNSAGKIRKLAHQKPYQLPISYSNATDAAIGYITELSSEFDVAQQLQNISASPQVDLNETALELPISDENEIQNISIRTFSQTYLRIPIWKAFVGVRLNKEDLNVFGATSYVVYQTPILNTHTQMILKSIAELTQTN